MCPNLVWQHVPCNWKCSGVIRFISHGPDRLVSRWPRTSHMYDRKWIYNGKDGMEFLFDLNVFGWRVPVRIRYVGRITKPWVIKYGEAKALWSMNSSISWYVLTVWHRYSFIASGMESICDRENSQSQPCHCSTLKTASFMVTLLSRHMKTYDQINAFQHYCDLVLTNGGDGDREFTWRRSHIKWHKESS